MSVKRGASERGQTLVEFSIVAVIFFVIVLGMIDIGRAVWNYNTLAQATREGTRFAIVHGAESDGPLGPGDEATISDHVVKHSSGMDTSALDIDVEWLDGDNGVGNRVRVTSEYTYTPVMQFLNIFSFSMKSSSTMTITN
jgi:Flp pilus assembly protein TadG